MAKTLYLHVGMPKCASTTIQDTLQSHAEVFAAHGKFYGFAPNDKTVGQGNAARLLADIIGKRTREVRKALAFFFERDSDIILSSEVFISLARSRMADDLIVRAAEEGFETRVICYLRRQDLWIESDYKQHIKGGSDWSEGIEALIAKRTRTRALNYHWTLSNWARAVGQDNITVVPLNAGQDELYPLERFLAFLDMDPQIAPTLKLPRQNVSPPVGLIEPMRYLKSALLARGTSPADISLELQRFAEVAPQNIKVPQRRFLLTPPRRRALLEDYAESNARLAATYLDGAPLFDAADLGEEAQALPPLSCEAAAVLADWSLVDAPRAPSHPQPETGSASKPGGWWPMWKR